MKRILLTVAYDGTDYHGWQQQEGVETIESVLNERLTELLREPIEVSGASRTDAGVHALGNLAVFDTTSRIPAEKLPRALNGGLPRAIRVVAAREVAADFHPRCRKTRKTYEYRILNAPIDLPQRSRYAYWYYGALDAERMRMAAQALLGEHDFTSFCSVHAQAQTRVRTIYAIDVRREPEDEIVLRVTGSGFLYHMVRIIAGTLIEIGRGQLPAEEMARILAARDRQAAGPTAPPEGLTLIGYEFAEEAIG